MARDTSVRSAARAPCAVAFFLAVAAALFAGPASADTKPRADRIQDPNQFLIVDCLLPGQVRRLGAGATFLTSRRPVRTSGADCEIRGGEYVAYDRANYKTALEVWLPAAKEGDPKAQTYVGEIYERGLGAEPDYRAAADWYRRAADKGYSRALVSLGNLYEHGLGVPSDRARALELYRKAAGKSVPIELIELAAAPDPAREAELQALRASFAATQHELAAMRNQLAAAEGERARLAAERDRLAAADRSNAQTLGPRLREREAEIERQREAAARHEHEVARLREELTRRDAERERNAEALGRSDREIGALKAELARTTAGLAAAETARRAAEQARATIILEQSAATKAQDQERAAALEARLKERDRELRAQGEEAERFRREIARHRDELTRLETARKADAAAAASQAGGQARETEAMRRELERARTELQASERARQKAEQDRAALLKENAASAQQRDTDRAQAFAGELKKRDEELARHRAQIAKVESELKEKTDMLGRLDSLLRESAGRSPAPEKAAATPSLLPVIEVIDPTLLPARGVDGQMASLRAGTTSRDIIGRVIARGGLYSLTVNDRRTDADAGGLFKSTVAVRPGQTPVQIVAIDREGRRAILDFLLSAGDQEQQTAERPKKRVPALKLGRFHALVIGNQAYRSLEKLDTSINDARAVAEVLERRFGFRVQTLFDATRYEIMHKLNELRDKLTDDDNLLIYYAGHGELDRANMRGHWLPIDAEKTNRANWISNVDVRDILNEMSAKHVLVIADSCFSGSITRSSGAQVRAGRTDDEEIERLRVLSQQRSRLAITSGDMQPVPDGGGGGKHSLFAKIFLDALAQVSEATDAQSLHRTISVRVHTVAQRFRIEMRPVYAAIPHTGHEMGDFVFVPRN